MGSVTRDKFGEISTSGPNTECEGADIDENDVNGSFGTREDATLDGGTIGNSPLRVDSLGKLLFTEKLPEELLGLVDTFGATNRDDLVDLVLLDVSVFQDLFNKFYGLPGEFLELGGWVSEKSLPSSKPSILILVLVWLGKVLLAFSISRLSLPRAVRSLKTSVPVRLYCLTPG